MSLIRPTSNVDRGSTPAPAPAGGGGDWNTLTPSDLQTEAQSIQTFTLSASPESGYENRISIANNAIGNATNFVRNDVGVVYFDTGFSLDDLDNGNSNNAVFQIAREPYNVVEGSSYQTEAAYGLSACLFSSLTPPPFSSGTKGGFYGHGLLNYSPASTNVGYDTFPKRLRDQTTANLRGTIYAYASGIDFLSLVHTVTVVQGIDISDNKTIWLSQGDFNAFVNKTSIPLEYSQYEIGQQRDGTDGSSNSSSDTVILGVMFSMYIDTANGGVNPSPTRTWDFNLKWRKLNQEA